MSAKRKTKEPQPRAVLTKSGVSFDIGPFARVRFDAGGGQAVSRELALRLSALWNRSRHLRTEDLLAKDTITLSSGDER